MRKEKTTSEEKNGRREMEGKTRHNERMLLNKQHIPNLCVRLLLLIPLSSPFLPLKHLPTQSDPLDQGRSLRKEKCPLILCAIHALYQRIRAKEQEKRYRIIRITFPRCECTADPICGHSQSLSFHWPIRFLLFPLHMVPASRKSETFCLNAEMLTWSKVRKWKASIFNQGIMILGNMQLL